MARKSGAAFCACIGVLCIMGPIIKWQGIGGLIFTTLSGCLFLGIAFLLLKSAKKSESKILRTHIVDTSGRTSTSSAVGRSAVGGFVAGPVGAVVGASTAKQNRETTFLIIYRDGSRKTKTVPNNSPEYKMYCKFLDA